MELMKVNFLISPDGATVDPETGPVLQASPGSELGKPPQNRPGFEPGSTSCPRCWF